MPALFPKRLPDRLALAMIVLHFGMVFWWIWTSFAVVDEAAHLGSGLATWETGNTRPYCVNPPLPRMIATLPLLAADARVSPLTTGAPGFRPEWSLAASLALNNPDNYVSLVRWCRLANLIWAGLLLYVLARWANDLYGAWGRFIAVALWCLEPTCIAYTGVVVPDVPATAAGLLASYVFWKYLREPTWGMAWFCGLALGLALSTKSIWLVLLPVWPTLMLIARLYDLRPRFLHLTLMLPVAGLVVCTGFGFSKMGRPLGDFEFVSKALGGTPSTESGLKPTPGNRFREGPVANFPVPLPADLLVGVDVQKYDFERGLHSYLNGEWRARGWWHYYLYAMALKLPIPTLLLMAAGAFWCLWWPRSPGRVDEWCLLTPAIVVIAFVSSQTGFNHHMRYVLPAFPFLFIAAGRLANLAETQKWLRGAIAALLIWCTTAAASVGPYFMSYFNPLAGGPDNGWKHLIDSNIDWGQDFLHLQRWLREHPEAKGIRVQYYNLMDPPQLGLDVGRVPTYPEPGYHAIDVNYVAGSWFRVGHRDGQIRPGPFAYFQRFKPIDKAGYSIFIYHVTEEEANRVRAEMGLPPWEAKP